MKKLVVALALAGFMGVAAAAPAVACEGGKCTMAHKDEGAKANKGKKATAKAEACPMSTAAAGAAPSCCMNKVAASGTDAAKPAKAVKAQ